MKDTQPPAEYYTPFPSLEDVENFTFKRFALDIETNRWTQEIICVGLCARPGFAICIPFKGPYIAALKKIILRAEEIITQNGLQFDIPILFKALDIQW